MDISPQFLPFDEAIEFFNRKGLKVSPDSWRDVWAAQHVHAFTVARVTSVDVLEDIRGAVGDAIAKGVPLNQFRSQLSSVLESKGWLARPGEKPGERLAPWRLDNIYATNLQSAYQAGRYKQMLEVARTRPYWQYDSVMDARTRFLHAAQNGKVYRFDHPFWDRWYPPNGFRCRCSVRTLSERQMRARGLKEEIAGTDFSPDEGFAYNPGEVAWEPDFNKYSPKARAILTEQQLGAPKDAPALAERLTRMRDGFKTTGLETSSAPLRLLEDTTSRNNGWTRYDTGEIHLRSDWYRAVRSALQTGEVQSMEQVNAFKTVIHEFGHHLGEQLEHPRYSRDRDYRNLSQVVNDLWARHNAPAVLKAVGLRYDASKISGLIAYHPTGYQPFVERMQAVLRSLNVDEAGEKMLCDHLNLSVASGEYSDRMWQLIEREKTGFRRPRWHFGQVLTRSDRFQWLMGLIGS